MQDRVIKKAVASLDAAAFFFLYLNSKKLLKNYYLVSIEVGILFDNVMKNIYRI